MILPSYGQWQTWTPDNGNLSVAFPGGEAINSLWLPSVPVSVAVNANGVLVYTANASGTETGAETIPLPPFTQSVELSASYAEPLYVFASNGAFNPYKEVPIVGVEAVTATSPLESSGGDTPNISLLVSTNPGQLLQVVGGALYAGYPYLCRLRLSGSDYNPVAPGLDSGSIVVVPWSPVDDVTVLTWNVIDAFARCEYAGTTNTTLNVVYSTGTGAFSSAGNITTSPIALPASTNESSRPATIAVPQLQSGWKVGVDYASVGTAVGGVSVYLVVEQSV